MRKLVRPLFSFEKHSVFEEDDIFKIIVPLNDEYSADRAVDKALPQTPAQETAQEILTDVESAILSLITLDAGITRSTMAVRLGLSSDSVKRRLESLKSKVNLRHEGPTKKGRWVFDGAKKGGVK